MNTEGSESVFSPSAVQSGDDVLLQYAAYDDATSTGYTVLLRTSLPNLPVLWASALPGGSTETLVEPHEGLREHRHPPGRAGRQRRHLRCLAGRRDRDDFGPGQQSAT